MEKIEIFKNNLEYQGFSLEFIKKSLEYFKELEEEREIQEMTTMEEIIQYYDECGSYTCDTIKSEDNLKELREDIGYLYNIWGDEMLNLRLYFNNIEQFEIQLLYVLYYEFYPNDEL